MSKKIVVDRKEFEKNFLGPIKSFSAKNEFLPIHYEGGKLVVFCANRTKDNGTLALYCEHTPEACELEEKEVLYIKEPDRLLKSISLLVDDRITLEVANHQLVCKTKKTSFKLTFYDPILAKRDKTFWKPEKFKALEPSFKEGFLVSKEDVARIKIACGTVNSDKVHLVNEDGGLSVNIGDDKTDCVSTRIEGENSFKDEGCFVKNILMFMGKQPVYFFESTDGNCFGYYIETDGNKLYYLVTKIQS